MGSKEKSRSGLKRTLLIASSLVLILSISLLVFIYLFLKSPLFPELLERILSSSLKKPVEVGSISFVRGSGIIINDLIIIEEKGPPLVILPRTVINLSLPGLLKRSIDNIALSKPKLFLNLGKKRAPEARAIRLPFSLKKTSITGGEVVVQLEKGVGIPFGPISLTLYEGPGGKAGIKGDAFVPLLNSTLTLEARLDMARLDIEKGHVDIGLIELEGMSTEDLNFLAKRKIKGSVRLVLDVLRGAEGDLGVEFKGDFQDLEVTGVKGEPSFDSASGRLRAFLKVAKDFSFVDVKAEAGIDTPSLEKGVQHKASLKGAYDVKALRTFQLISPHMRLALEPTTSLFPTLTALF
jgi:hypothetical protein